MCIPSSGVLKFSVTARRIAARRRPLPPSPSVCLTSIRRRTRRNPRPCVWTADSRLTSAYLTLCGITWETILPIQDRTCSKWLYCRLGGDPSLPRYSDCIASYIPTGLLQHSQEMPTPSQPHNQELWTIKNYRVHFDWLVDGTHATTVTNEKWVQSIIKAITTNWKKETWDPTKRSNINAIISQHRQRTKSTNPTTDLSHFPHSCHIPTTHLTLRTPIQNLRIEIV